MPGNVVWAKDKFSLVDETTAFNPILHTAWLQSHVLTFKNNTAKGQGHV